VSAAAAAPVAAPIITSGTPPARAAYSKQYSFTFTATVAAGLTPAFALVGSYPTGMTIDPDTGVLTWTGEAPGRKVQSASCRRSRGMLHQNQVVR
jgi:hypothetical protein